MRRATVVHVGSGPTHPDNRTAQALAPTLVLRLVLAPSLGFESPDGTDAHHAASEAAEYEAFVRDLPPCCIEGGAP